METLKVGMYCRTINGIQKFIKETDDVYAFDKGVIIKPDNIEKYIIKASHNIIDLIEVGDYVNSELVQDITGEYIRIGNISHNKSWLSNNIKTILTKEKFENNCYKIEN